ncbi:FMN-binding negative transcriptional regulator [Pelagibius sp. Alg239-R121]|uniref:FMN-binding negative transcriptional regulator n=1 Tax=Pelagibius sp. Alg239-R121 TaxID=2993448 RepID=UPI0024A73CD4|nr:FMN-binding negative transcriptional regulator [Pelagibius sp. Alg239-R121]
MYVPDSFALTDPDEVREVIRSYDFGLLVTAPDGVPNATHLPFVLDESLGLQGTLLGHMARPNSHWRDFDSEAQGKEALVVFQGPHSYISPSLYGPEAKAVPTWNYVAIHIYGHPRIVRAQDRVMALLDRMVKKHEAEFERPWSLERLDSGFVQALTRGIVCFEIPIERIEAKAKLSQNKEIEMQRNAASVLSEGTADARKLSALMMKGLAG